MIAHQRVNVTDAVRTREAARAERAGRLRGEASLADERAAAVARVAEVLGQGSCDAFACSDHGEHVYILCYGKPTVVSDRDHFPADPEYDYPITHYVGWTSTQPPVKRIRSHGAKSAHFIATVIPGSMDDEELIKQLGACPVCDGGLFYFAESPGWNPRSSRFRQAARARWPYR